MFSLNWAASSDDRPCSVVEVVWAVLYFTAVVSSIKKATDAFIIQPFQLMVWFPKPPITFHIIIIFTNLSLSKSKSHSGSYKYNISWQNLKLLLRIRKTTFFLIFIRNQCMKKFTNLLEKVRFPQSFMIIPFSNHLLFAVHLLLIITIINIVINYLVI